MSVWDRISEILDAITPGRGLSDIFASFNRPPEKSVAFAISVIALGAKMAKADGHVTKDEVAAFREIFVIEPEEEENAARVYNLARQETTGFEDYAKRIARMFPEDSETLVDLLEGLFFIASADGEFHPGEDDFLRKVANTFRIGEAEFEAIKSRFVRPQSEDPYSVLGVTRDMSMEEIRARWRELVRENHPDRLIARGLPEEAVTLGTKRLARINLAWEKIQATAPRA